MNIDDTDTGFLRDTNVHFGWAVGTGADFAVSDSMSLKDEHLYADLGSRLHPLAVPGGPADAGFRFPVVRIGANFHF